jgi:hypothetical protein
MTSWVTVPQPMKASRTSATLMSRFKPRPMIGKTKATWPHRKSIFNLSDEVIAAARKAATSAPTPWAAYSCWCGRPPSLGVGHGFEHIACKSGDLLDERDTKEANQRRHQDNGQDQDVASDVIEPSLNSVRNPFFAAIGSRSTLYLVRARSRPAMTNIKLTPFARKTPASPPVAEMIHAAHRGPSTRPTLNAVVWRAMALGRASLPVSSISMAWRAVTSTAMAVP